MKSRTTLEIDSELLLRAMELYGCNSKTQVIDLALKELVRKRLREQFLEELRSGGFEFGMSVEEFEAQRELDRKREHLLDQLRDGEPLSPG